MKATIALTLAVVLVMISGPVASAQQFTIDQTLSDEAQRKTIAFSGLAFVTGSLGADSFFPPGKVADFWGFQYFRDNDPTEMGHNTDFLTRAANNVLSVLSEDQLAELVALAEGQVDQINQYAYDRFVLMNAFRVLLEGNLPEGSSGLDLAAVQEFSSQLYRLDGEISLERAEIMGRILASLDATQRSYLDSIAGTGMLDWPNPGDQLDPREYPRDVHVAVMTYAADMLSWHVGSLEADVYFCPERQGTYFGSFYLKDAPAMGNPDYTIPSNLTAEMGDAFLAVLTVGQEAMISDLVDEQRDWLYEIVERREDVALELRRCLTGETADRESVLSLMERYGTLDGNIAFAFATSFAELAGSLSTSQLAELVELRSELGVSAPDGAYLYSEPIAMPAVPNSDFLFDGGQSSEPSYVYWVEIAANVSGLYGSRWRTDLAIRNSSAEVADITVVLHTADGEASFASVVEGSSQAVFENIVGLLGVTGKGALEIRSSQPAAAVARTYNQTDQGTLGQLMVACSSDQGLSAGETGWLLGLRQLDGTYRSNVSVTNTGSAEAIVDIELHLTDGSLSHAYSLIVESAAVLQDIEPFKHRAGRPDLGWGFARISVRSGSGVLSSATVIDSRTNDATTIALQR